MVEGARAVREPRRRSRSRSREIREKRRERSRERKERERSRDRSRDRKERSRDRDGGRDKERKGSRRRKNEGMNRKRMILTGKPMEKKVIQNLKGNLRKMMKKIMRKRQKKMVLRKMEKMKSNLKGLQEIPVVGLEINQGNLKKRMIKRNLKMWKSRKRMKVLLRKEITEAIEKTRLILMWILKEEKKKNQGRNPRKGDAPKKSDLGHALLVGKEEAVGMVEGQGQGKE